MSTAPCVLNLANQTAVLAFHRIGEAFETIRIVLSPDLNSRQTRLMSHHAEGLRHAQCRAACRPIRMIQNLPVRDPSGRRRESRNGRMSDPIA